MWNKKEMQITLKEAASLVNKNKTTLFRHVKQGKLPSKKNDAGVILVNKKDVIHLYKPSSLKSKTAVKENANDNIILNDDKHLFDKAQKQLSDLLMERERLSSSLVQLQKENDMLNREASLKDKRIFELRSENEHIKADKFNLECRLEEITILLKNEVDKKKKKSFFQRIFC